MRVVIFLTVAVLSGCQTAKNSIETGASTTAIAGSPVIEKVDLNIRYRMEW
jgi:uncharacterized lipoprotein YajG